VPCYFMLFYYFGFCFYLYFVGSWCTFNCRVLLYVVLLLFYCSYLYFVGYWYTFNCTELLCCVLILLFIVLICILLALGAHLIAQCYFMLFYYFGFCFYLYFVGSWCTFNCTVLLYVILLLFYCSYLYFVGSWYTFNCTELRCCVLILLFIVLICILLALGVHLIMLFCYFYFLFLFECSLYLYVNTYYVGHRAVQSVHK
jgi:hypothetical protein